MDKLTERLLGLMQIGARLEAHDGHIWIYSDEGDDDFLENILQEASILLNNKIYGGVLEALDTIDEALRLADKPSLATHYSPEMQFLGEAGVDKSRIGRSGKGGLM